MKHSIFTNTTRSGFIISLVAITLLLTSLPGRAQWKTSLEQNQYLARGGQIFSPSGRYVFINQVDGNQVVYDRQGQGCAAPGCPLWSSNTNGMTTARLHMQGDGNLVLKKNGRGVWDSKTGGGKYPPYRLLMQDDGNLVIYNSRRQGVWSSATGPTNRENGAVTGADAVAASSLYQNQALRKGESLVSPNGIYSFYMQKDGNAVVYRKTATDNCTAQGCSVWSSNTANQRATDLLLQGDGNLIIRRGTASVWDSKSSSGKYPPYRLQMQDDGNLVIYNAAGKGVWSTQTGLVPE